MSSEEKTTITIQVKVNAPVDKTWECWTQPEHITGWNFASDDWHTPWAKSDLRPGGSFSSRMEARDGSMGFDFYGTFDEVVLHKKIASTLGDGRKVTVEFRPEESYTGVVESFEAENVHSAELQRNGWQAILNNFKKYVENSASAKITG